MNTMETGDILLQHDPTSEFEAQIAMVAPQSPYFHVAMVVGEGKIIEAVAEHGVQCSKLTDWLRDKSTHIYRIQGIEMIRDQIHDFASPLVGQPYNRYFLRENDGYYCSELIQHIVNTLFGYEVIADTPMNFLDLKGKISPFWQEYYAHANLPIPHGAPGTHPSSLAQNSRLIRIGSYTSGGGYGATPAFL